GRRGGRLGPFTCQLRWRGVLATASEATEHRLVDVDRAGDRDIINDACHALHELEELARLGGAGAWGVDDVVGLDLDVAGDEEARALVQVQTIDHWNAARRGG